MPKSYIEDKKIAHFIAGNDIEIFLYNEPRRSLVSLLRFKKYLDDMVRLVPPALILMPPRSQPHHEIIKHVAEHKGRRCKFFYYQNGRGSVDWSSEKQIKDLKAETNDNPSVFPRAKIFRKAIRLLKFLDFIKVNYLWIVFCSRNSGKPFFRSYSYLPNGPGLKRCNNLNSAILQYSRPEQRAWQRITDIKVCKAPHPIKLASRENIEKLYGTQNKENNIVVLPGRAPAVYVDGNLLCGEERAVFIKKQWLEVAVILNKFMPEKKVYFKLHPRTQVDPSWRDFACQLEKISENLIFLPPEAIAEEYIWNSEIIVGDISSTLWWASFLGNKSILSLDIFGAAGGGDFASYENITVVNSVSELKAILHRLS